MAYYKILSGENIVVDVLDLSIDTYIEVSKNLATGEVIEMIEEDEYTMLTKQLEPKTNTSAPAQFEIKYVGVAEVKKDGEPAGIEDYHIRLAVLDFFASDPRGVTRDELDIVFDFLVEKMTLS